MKNDIKLTKFTRFSGCGAKLGPGTLDKALCGLEQPDYPGLIADFRTSEDSGIFKISDDTALIQTIDFFPPIVDDPFIFGQIAAANSLSDIYAMGAKPVTALTVLCFPEKKMEMEHLRRMIAGGMDKLAEAETALVGGHSIKDEELKFGFAVTGIINPEKALRNNTLKPNETLILTKPLGIGTINSALRGKFATDRALSAAVKSMISLNKKAAEIIGRYPVSACTDVTGFGFLGHACEMMAESPAGMSIDFKEIKLFPDVPEYISKDFIPAGTYKNREFRIKYIKDADKIPEDTLNILFDPQTSGGLLFAIPKEYASDISAELKESGHTISIAGETTTQSETIELHL